MEPRACRFGEKNAQIDAPATRNSTTVGQVVEVISLLDVKLPELLAGNCMVHQMPSADSATLFDSDQHFKIQIVCLF